MHLLLAILYSASMLLFIFFFLQHVIVAPFGSILWLARTIFLLEHPELRFYHLDFVLEQKAGFTVGAFQTRRRGSKNLVLCECIVLLELFRLKLRMLYFITNIPSSSHYAYLPSTAFSRTICKCLSAAEVVRNPISFWWKRSGCHNRSVTSLNACHMSSFRSKTVSCFL